MKIYYRISNNSYDKSRLDWATKEYCFNNFISKFKNHISDITVIADNVSDDTLSMIERYILTNSIIRTELGHGALAFNYSVQLTSNLPNSEIVYFVEDDYLHIDNSDKVLEDAICSMGVDFVSLYDHPDKYLNPSEGGNPYCSGRSEESRVYLGNYSHYKLTNSTTMTFGCRVSAINQYFNILQKWTSQKHPPHYPYDFYMFSELISNGARVISSIPAYATHIETRWLSPLIDWSSV